ncbi:hypothetical protein IKF04_02485 [Candidatus Saccharibacteria bacterium]|nr:hypothetical protein [Candidatus Saccharibacteria bacterium]
MDSSFSPDDTPKQSSHDNRVHPAVIATISTIVGLVVGALGVYGLIKLIEKPCNCPKGSTSVDLQNLKGLELVDLGFLKLESDSKNLIYSPLSIRYGLSLLGAGAKGETKDEITKLLTEAQLPQYQNVPDNLSLANAVFVRDAFKNAVLPKYTQIIKDDYNGEIIYDNFASSHNMDSWVDKKTFGLIDQIGVAPTINTQMILANALAIQMDWEHKFDTNDTYGRTFLLADGSEMQATTMYQETNAGDVRYFTDESTTAISLPLDSTDGNVDLEFIAIMPSGDLGEYTKNVNYSILNSVIDQMTPANEQKGGVIIHIPKFKFDYKLDFENDLKSLGIETAFDERTADFSEMATEPLYVGEASHNANIDFSEDGIKAAAVTSFGLKLNSAENEDEVDPVVVNIDHPFLFIIRDAKNSTNWFTGTVYRPNLWEDDAASYRY